ncbi:MAG: VCBS repeat-containing protein [Deltaproteobacteria bacterium]|nr:VCBS repeat-containing protein [Deltaproteobacteria bacterium]
MKSICVSGLILVLVIAGPAQFKAHATGQLFLDRVLEGEWNHPTWLSFGGGHGWSKPTFGDLDGDGDQDLLVGETEGNVVFYRNNGTRNYPQWTQETRSIAPGEREAMPALADIDGDGDLDLFIGSAYGRIRFYRNIGSPHRHHFQLIDRAYLSIDAGQPVAPTFVDFDRDGDLDLVISQGDGLINLYRNNGTPRSPTWAEPVLVVETQDGGMTCPAFADVDGDGDADLLVGTQTGCLRYYRNVGDTTESRFALDSGLHRNICVEGLCAPALVDIDGDGDLDLFIGSDSGNIFFLRNDGNARTPNWQLVTRHYVSVDLGSYSHPTLGDIDGDGDIDMLVGLENGLVAAILNRGNNRSPQWSPGPLHYLSIQPVRHAAPCLVDLDGDGDLDVLIGGADGRVQFFMNTGRRDLPEFSLTSSAYAGINVEANAAPAAADLDGDGDMDILVGGVSGDIYHYRNDGTAVIPVWTLVTNRFNGISMGQNASPVLADMDDDGIPDLLVGNESGAVAFFEGRGSAGAQYSFSNRTTNLLSASIGRRVAPAAGDVDGDMDNDLIIGSSRGGVVFYRNALPRMPVVPREITVTTGAQLNFQAQPTGETIRWSLLENPSGGIIGTQQGNYRAGSASGVTDIVRAIDSVGNVGYAYVHVISRADQDLAGKAIIIAGTSPEQRLNSATNRLGNLAYLSLLHLGYARDKIVYLNASPNQDVDDNGHADDVTAVPSRESFETFVRPLVSNQSGETLLVYLVGNGTTEGVTLNPAEILTFAELDQWLDGLQEGNDRLVIVICDAPTSGSAIPVLQAPRGKQRIVITSCSEGAGTYFAGEGRISFSQNFWSMIAQGKTLVEAMGFAWKSLSFYTGQSPSLDDNGNGRAGDPGDGVLAGQTRLGVPFIQGGDYPLIGKPFGAIELTEDISAPLQMSEVSDRDGISRAWAAVRPPADHSAGRRSAPQAVVDLPLIEMVYDPYFRIYRAMYDQFLHPGQYDVFLYAEDTWMNVSLPMVNHVFQSVSGVTFQMQTDRTRYAGGDTGVLSVLLAGSGRVDVYLSLRHPDDSIHYLILRDGILQWAEPGFVEPLGSDWEVTPYSGPLFRFDLEGMMAGTYIWAGIFTQPGGDVSERETWLNSHSTQFYLE